MAGIPRIEIHVTLSPKPGFKAAAWRGVAQLMGRSSTTVLRAKPFGMVPRFHPFNLLPRIPEDQEFGVYSDIGHTSTQRFSRTKSRTGDGLPSLPQRTSKSPRFGKKRRRCKHRNKAGKRCLRPAGHSGRHRYR